MNDTMLGAAVSYVTAAFANGKAEAKERI